MAGFPKGRRIPLVEGGVNAPPENARVQGGRRSPCREFTFLGQALAEEVTIHDKDRRVKERIQDGTIYDRDWRVKRHIEDGRVYDRDWRLQNRIEDGKIYDRNWNLKGRFDYERIYDRNWNTKGDMKKGK